MERKVFDMNQCKPGDRLITKSGAKVAYLGKADDEFFGKYFHYITYIDDCGCDRMGSRTDEGFYFGSGLASDNDIVGFWKG